MLFTDESKFNIFNCDGRIYLTYSFRIFKPELSLEVVVLWSGSCIASMGIGELQFIEGNMGRFGNLPQE